LYGRNGDDCEECDYWQDCDQCVIIVMLQQWMALPTLVACGRHEYSMGGSLYGLVTATALPETTQVL